MYRRLRGADQAHWLASVVKRTWVAAASVLVALVIGGAVMQHLAPEASTLGETIGSWWLRASPRTSVIDGGC